MALQSQIWYNTSINKAHALLSTAVGMAGRTIRSTDMSTIPQPHFYVYVLARPNGKPFYVGKGVGRRVYRHEEEARSGCPCHKCSVIRKIWKQGGEVQRYTVFTTDNEQEAFAYEIELIALYGRGNLTNHTDGGEGASNPSPEYRQKLSEAQKRMGISLERRASMLDGIRKAWASLELKMRRSKTMRAHYQMPENREARSIAQQGHKRGPISDEARRNMSKPHIGREMAEEVRQLYATDRYTMRMLAEQFGVSLQTISNIINRRVYP